MQQTKKIGYLLAAGATFGSMGAAHADTLTITFSQQVVAATSQSLAHGSHRAGTYPDGSGGLSRQTGRTAFPAWCRRAHRGRRTGRGKDCHGQHRDAFGDQPLHPNLLQWLDKPELHLCVRDHHAEQRDRQRHPRRQHAHGRHNVHTRNGFDTIDLLRRHHHGGELRRLVNCSRIMDAINDR